MAASSILTAALLLAAAAAAFSSGAWAQHQLAPPMSAAPSPAPTCQELEIDNLLGCLTYVETGSNLTAPDGDCCKGFKSLVDINPICLCELLAKGSPVPGITIDRSRAMKLPGACKVDTPPVSLCSAVGIPVSSPTASSGMMPPAASAPAPDCLTLEFDDLSNCLNYVQKGSNQTVPDKGCCSGFGTLVKTQPICLCKLLSESEPFPGLEIDKTKALMLPTVCRVKTPSPTLCSVAGFPISPAPSTVAGVPISPAPTAEAPAAALGPSPSAYSAACLGILTSEMASCLTYAQKGSSETKPAKECCTGLGFVVKTQPSCLCLKVAPMPGIDLDPARELNIPKACGVDTASLCKASSQAPGSSIGTSPSPTSPAGSFAVELRAHTAVMILAGLSLAALPLF